MNEIKKGDYVIELFEKNPRKGKVLDVKKNVLTVEIEDGYTISHESNFKKIKKEVI